MSNDGIQAEPAILSSEEQGNNEIRGGPGLLFKGNKVIGFNGQHDRDWKYPDEGVFIGIPQVTKLPSKYQPKVEGNEFVGVIDKAIQLNSGSAAFILKNSIKPRSDGAHVQGGFLLTGTASANPPLYTLSGNDIKTKLWGVKFEDNIHLSMAKNTMTSNEAFKQPETSSLISVFEVPQGENCETCNIWTKAPDSVQDDVCEGLYHVDGNIHFKSITCSTVHKRAISTTAQPGPASAATRAAYVDTVITGGLAAFLLLIL